MFVGFRRQMGSCEEGSLNGEVLLGLLSFPFVLSGSG